MTTQPSTLALVLASDEKGVEGLSVAAYTALKHCSLPVDLWIIAEGISPHTQARLRALWVATGQLQQLHFVAPPQLPAWWATRQYPLITWARIQMDRILPETVARCVYIDTDVLVGADLAKLCAMPLQENIVGMVQNTGLNADGARYVESLGLTAKTYYNSGVLLMDMDAWRREHAREGLMARRGTLPVTLHFPDQDLLNIYFAGRILPLAECWNMRDAAAQPDGNVLHFAGSRKPWAFRGHEEMPAGVRAWQDALPSTARVRQRISLWRRCRRTIRMLRVVAERLVRRRL